MGIIQKYNNSFFILNKIDLINNINEREQQKKIFNEVMLEKELKVDSKDDTIHLKYLSCKELTIEIEKYENFKSYLKFLLIKEDKKEENFLEFLNADLKKRFNIDINIIGNDNPSDGDLSNIIQDITELSDEYSNFTLNFVEYYNYEKIFNDIKLLKKDNEIQTYKYLSEDFNKSFHNSLKNFINIKNDEFFSNKIKKIEENINKISKYDKYELFKTKEYMDFLYKKLSNNFEFSLEKFQKLRPIVDELSELENNLSVFQNLKEDYLYIEHFIKKNKKIRIPLLGGYSTGKSSILNNIIGKKLLPEGINITTYKIIVIRNNDENKYILSKSKFKPTDKRNKEYFSFEEGKVIYNCNETNYYQIYKYLEEKNEEQKNKAQNNNNIENNLINGDDDDDLYYLLSVPLTMFKEMNLNKEILDKIELIDFPGIDAIDFKDENLTKLIHLSDTFIFVNEYTLIKNTDNINILKKVVSRIESRKMQDFDYNSCLFVLNKADADSTQKNKDKNCIENIKLEKKKEIEDILFGIKDIYKIFDIFKKKDNSKIDVTLFSSRNYSKYLDFYEKIKDFNEYINNKTLEIQKKNNNNSLLRNLQIEIQTDNYLQYGPIFINENIKNLEENKYYIDLNNFLIKNGFSENELKSQMHTMKNIIEYYAMMRNNLNKNKYYINSLVNTFYKDLEKKFMIAKEMTEYQYKEKIKHFIDNLQLIFQLLQQKSLKNRIINMKEIKDKIIKKEGEFKLLSLEYSKRIIERIDDELANFLSRIENLKDSCQIEENKTINLKNELEELKKLFINKTKELTIFMNGEILSLQKIINRKLNSELRSFGVEANDALDWKKKIIDYGKQFFNYCYGIIEKLYYIFKGKKGRDKLMNEIYYLEDEIKDKMSSISSNFTSLFEKLLNESVKLLYIIYETQISNLNKNKIQNLFENFIHDIGDKYVGDMKDNQKHGKGILYYYNGDVFKGEYQDNYREGFGIMNWVKTNHKYIGEWKQNDREGYGKYFFPNGNYYEGEFKNNQMEGYGNFYYYTNNNRYEGNFVDGDEDGFGIFMWNNGDKYIGEFKESQFNGMGKIVFNNGNVFEGEFNKDKRNGFGAFCFLDGSKFEGEWYNNKKNGKGIFYSKEGKIYKGYWKNNRKILDNYIENEEYIKHKVCKLDNKIQIEYIDGDSYEGDYNPLTKTIEGYGKYKFNYGAKYVGNFKNNQFHGEGTFFYDGDETKGFFENGELNGVGEIIYKNGDTFTGCYNNGKKEGTFIFFCKKKNQQTYFYYKNNEFIETIDD